MLKIPVIDCTDLYHPHQDPGDNFDLIAAYGLPEIDLRGVVLDVTERFRLPPGERGEDGQATDSGGPREPGIVPVTQLNYIFGRAVPPAAMACVVAGAAVLFTALTLAVQWLKNRPARRAIAKKLPEDVQ